MPSYKLLVVTGANGYVGLHVVRAALVAGVAAKIRAIVRSESSAAPLRSLFGPALQAGTLEIAFVPDMTAEGAYDAALSGGVDGVIHVASPLPPSELVDAEKQLLGPARQGALNILRAAGAAQSVRKVVLTSSVSANYIDEHTRMSNASWNPISEDAARSTTVPSLAYRASKTFAERAAWEYVKEYAPGFALTALNPVYIIGPSLLSTASIQSTTNNFIYRAAIGEASRGQVYGYVDVRDTALAHVLALTQPKTDGKRYLLQAGVPTNVEVAQMAKECFPEGPWKVPAPGGPATIPTTIDVADLEGFAFRTVRESFMDTWNAELQRVAADSSTS